MAGRLRCSAADCGVSPIGVTALLSPDLWALTSHCPCSLRWDESSSNSCQNHGLHAGLPASFGSALGYGAVRSDLGF